LFNESALEREATVNVDCGLYILRYVSGATSSVSPVALARPAPGSEPFIEVISAPGVVTGLLSRPGECVVVRAERSGLLSVKIMRSVAGASLDASFRLEPIGEPASGSAVASNVGSAAVMPYAPADGALNFRLLAHVSRRGDIEVGAGEWVAGPRAPAAIEGIEIRASRGPGAQIEIQPLVAGNPPGWLDWKPAGVFAGSRGRFLSLAGLRLRLVGDAAMRFVLSADALFLGSAIVSRRGREIELVGAAGGDPLVGLRLDMAPVVSTVVGVGNGEAVDTALAPQRPSPRVRVFRAAASN
jgi:hypothetical protein